MGVAVGDIQASSDVASEYLGDWKFLWWFWKCSSIQGQVGLNSNSLSD